MAHSLLDEENEWRWGEVNFRKNVSNMLSHYFNLVRTQNMDASKWEKLIFNRSNYWNEYVTLIKAFIRLFELIHSDHCEVHRWPIPKGTWSSSLDDSSPTQEFYICDRLIAISGSIMPRKRMPCNKKYSHAYKVMRSKW